MTRLKISKQESDKFGRTFTMLFNRATMYQIDHPSCEQSLEAFNSAAANLLESVPTVALTMNREQFFVDEEPLDPRINVSRMVAHFRKAGIESVSFNAGLGRDEIRTFLEIFVSLNRYPHVAAMTRALEDKGIKNLKINHVFFKKVTIDDEVISRSLFEEIAPDIGDEDHQRKSKQLFLNMVLESVLAEEFAQTLSIQNLVNNPVGLSANMIQADINSLQYSDAEDRRPGLVLLHQLEMIDQEVQKGINGEVELNLTELVAAVFGMKKQLIEGIGAQKSLNFTYANEQDILDRANEITDKVLVKLIKDEYKAGEISAPRLAQILRRLIPETDELRRVLPKIKKALIDEGMPLSEYWILAQELGRELESEELARILQASSEKVGIDGNKLIEEIKHDPDQAAKLICLAAEIRKGSGDDKVLTDLLVEYVERVSSKLTLDVAEENGTWGEQHLRRVITGFESNIVKRLKQNDVNESILERLEERLNNRLDLILERMRNEWRQSSSHSFYENGSKNQSVLEILEQSVGENEELGEILKMVRSKARSRDIDENDFGQIYEEVVKRYHERKEKEAKNTMPPGVLKSQELIYLIKKEISRTGRYGVPFSCLAFMLVSAKPQEPLSSGTIAHQDLMHAILYELSTILRDADIVGQVGKYEMVALLPMTLQQEARIPLRRCLKILNTEPVKLDGTSVRCIIAGIAKSFDPKLTPDFDTFVRTLSDELRIMVMRVKNIQELT